MKFRNPFKTRIAYICTPLRNYHIEVPFFGHIRIASQELLNLKGKRIEYLIVDDDVPVHNDTSINLISTPYNKNVLDDYFNATKKLVGDGYTMSHQLVKHKFKGKKK
jgi:hypothetical protein